MNIYISQPVQDNSRRHFERFRFPVAQYARRYFRTLTEEFVDKLVISLL